LLRESLLGQGQKFQLTCQVRRNQIRMLFDVRTIVKWEGDFDRPSVTNSWDTSALDGVFGLLALAPLTIRRRKFGHRLGVLNRVKGNVPSAPARSRRPVWRLGCNDQPNDAMGPDCPAIAAAAGQATWRLAAVQVQRENTTGATHGKVGPTFPCRQAAWNYHPGF